jgi:hypothetical protein
MCFQLVFIPMAHPILTQLRTDLKLLLWLINILQRYPHEDCKVHTNIILSLKVWYVETYHINLLQIHRLKCVCVYFETPFPQKEGIEKFSMIKITRFRQIIIKAVVKKCHPFSSQKIYTLYHKAIHILWKTNKL